MSIGIRGYPQGNRLPDAGVRIPFGLIDVNGTGDISRSELAVALNRIFPSLTDQQCSVLSEQAFAVGAGLYMNRDRWAMAEDGVLQSAKQLDLDNAVQRGTVPSGWTGQPASGQLVVGQNQIPLSPAELGGGYLPRNDYAMTGYYPYQYPL